MLAVVFPGQGSQSVGMSADFVRDYSEARAVFEEADEAFGGPLSSWILEGPESELRRTEVTQPAILAASLAAYRVLEPRLGLPPAVLAGHSLGEYSALVAAGALDLGDAVRLVRRRGAYMQEAVPEGRGGMFAVLGLPGEQVHQICRKIEGEVAAANFNSPEQTVIAGERSALAGAVEACEKAGAKRVVPLEVSAPFHCNLMRPAMEKLTAELTATRFRDLRIPVVSNVTTEVYRTADLARALLRRQVCAPVGWVGCVQKLVQAGVTVHMEVGPGKVLTGLAGRIDKGLKRVTCSTVGDLEKALAAVEGLA
jgi:[acyl-carrier-protein] S-malonyltransferase